MIWVLLGTLIAGLVVGGGLAGGDSVRFPAHDRIEDVVDDETRREEADAILDEAEANLARTISEQLAATERLGEISGDRNTSRADIEAMVGDLERNNQAQLFIDLRFRLKNTLTRDEWEELFPAPGASSE